MSAEKAVRLVEFLVRLASISTKQTRQVTEYDQILWLSDIPVDNCCYTQAWGPQESYDPDIWIEVRSQPEPPLPSVPPICKEWLDPSSLRNKSDLPELKPQITVEVSNPDGRGETDQLELVFRPKVLEDHAEVRQAWERYVADQWLPWTEKHNTWETIHKPYAKLFEIHDELLRRSEEYELIIGLGLLTWKTPTGQQVRRHLVVANALLEFEARLKKFVVRPMPDGARIRPELDMLDIDDRPAHAERDAHSLLANAEDHLWEKDCIEAALKTLVHSIDPNGEYVGTLEANGSNASAKPIVEYAPALILRKRSTGLLTDILNRIKANIEAGGSIPPGFRDLAELPPDTHDASAGTTDWAMDDTDVAFDGEVFFPKPSNEEQRRILSKMHGSFGVLVQGPPGTGKSHTIANLICHLLATGHRILVTAKTPRALQVLLGGSSTDAEQNDKARGLIPNEIRPLCINLLGRGLEEMRSLESSVNGILSKNEEWNDERADRDCKGLEHSVASMREDKAKVDRRLREIRESETLPQSVANGVYSGTAAKIAERVKRESDTYSWFTDTVPLNALCPVSEDVLREVLAELRRLTKERRLELLLTWPLDLPSTQSFGDLVEQEKKAIDAEMLSASGADGPLAERLSNVDIGSVKEMRDRLLEIQGECRRLSALPYSWMNDALRDIMGGRTSSWSHMAEVTKGAVASVQNLILIADENKIDFPEGISIETLQKDVSTLLDHTSRGMSLGWWVFRPALVKERIYVLETIQVNGHLCSNNENIRILADALRVRVQIERAIGTWGDCYQHVQSTYARQAQELKEMAIAIECLLSLKKQIDKCQETLRQQVQWTESIWLQGTHLEKVVSSHTLALAKAQRKRTEAEFRKVNKAVVTAIAGKEEHPTVAEVLKTVRERNLASYSRVRAEIEGLEKDRDALRKLDKYINITLRPTLPKLTGELEDTCSESCWDTRAHQLQAAWHWAQAKYWIDEYIRKDDVPALERRAKQIEDKINQSIAEIASLRAWSFCLKRLTEKYRRHMEAWQQSMRKYGKGTGKHAPRYRREAQHHLNECREAVPAWVMPLHRIWDTVDPASQMFDVIIVDEASQCGFEALPLFYLGKKIIIVGDEKQISPDAVGIPLDSVTRLREEFISDFEFKDSLTIASSLFAHGKLRLGTHRIALREHFRCMPEIIRFSNDLCYSDAPLVPLRQYGPDRLPPTEHVFVEGGYREGVDNRVINRPEAEAIVAKIVELCRDSRYSNKTMGVVVLQGEAQATLIAAKLRERLEEEEIEKRRLVCGNPYSFQGDERDIMFLSMVAAPNERIGAFAKHAYEQRFNVAASRARDQMFLFHSVTLNDLSQSCLRYRLLQFFENTKPREIAGIKKDELELRAHKDNRLIVKPPEPFDSWFEVDVALELARKGFEVHPQYPIAGKRIDLVIEGGQSRLAVECDGDFWHGPEQYDEDVHRQRQLERCGWEFFRVKESDFLYDRQQALSRLWPMLEERGIVPYRFASPLESGRAVVGLDVPKAQADEAPELIRDLAAYGFSLFERGNRIFDEWSHELKTHLPKTTDTVMRETWVRVLLIAKNVDTAKTLGEPVELDEIMARVDTEMSTMSAKDRTANIVEIGDTVTYINETDGTAEMRVLITTKPSNPDWGMINENTPLARALLGAQMGQAVVARLPVGQVQLTVRDISKGSA